MTKNWAQSVMSTEVEKPGLDRQTGFRRHWESMVDPSALSSAEGWTTQHSAEQMQTPGALESCSPGTFCQDEGNKEKDDDLH